MSKPKTQSKKETNPNVIKYKCGCWHTNYQGSGGGFNCKKHAEKKTD